VNNLRSLARYTWASSASQNQSQQLSDHFQKKFSDFQERRISVRGNDRPSYGALRTRSGLRYSKTQEQHQRSLTLHSRNRRVRLGHRRGREIRGSSHQSHVALPSGALSAPHTPAGSTARVLAVNSKFWSKTHLLSCMPVIPEHPLSGFGVFLHEAFAQLFQMHWWIPPPFALFPFPDISQVCLDLCPAADLAAGTAHNVIIIPCVRFCYCLAASPSFPAIDNFSHRYNQITGLHGCVVEAAFENPRDSRAETGSGKTTVAVHMAVCATRRNSELRSSTLTRSAALLDGMRPVPLERKLDAVSADATQLAGLLPRAKAGGVDFVIRFANGKSRYSKFTARGTEQGDSAAANFSDENYPGKIYNN
jgi:hypothetical protein